MDHEGIPCSSKVCDWLLNSFWDHFGLYQGKKNVRVAMELEVSERLVFRPTIFVVMILKGFAVERQKRFSSYECLGTMAEKCCFNTFLIISFEQ
jgi:hypothetical protein